MRSARPARLVSLVATLTLVGALALPRFADAEAPAPAEAPLPVSQASAAAPAEWLVSLPLLGLERGSLAVQGERYLGERWAVTAAVAARRVDAGDFDARGLALGGGVRWFFYPFHRWGHGGGAFLAGRVDGTWRWLIDERDGRSIGDSVQLATSALVGWRLVAWKHLELTPEVGLTVAREWTTAELAANTTLAPTFGLTVGYIW